MKTKGKKTGLTLTGIAAAVVLGGLWWRRESQRRNLPTPAWLSWIFDNPLAEGIARSQANLDRIGVRPGERILDVGSGPGRLTIPAARRVLPGGSVVALDLQPGMLERLEKKVRQAGLGNVELHLGDIARIETLPAGSFDRAYMVTVLGEIPAGGAALENLFGLLKPGGILSITEMLPDPHYQRREVVLNMAWETGFEPAGYWGWVGGYTQNFVRPQENT